MLSTIFFAVCLACLVHGISPKMANFFAWVLTLGFIFPFFTIAGGTVTWAIVNLVSGFSFWGFGAWLGCCAFCGLPLATFLTLFVLKD